MMSPRDLAHTDIELGALAVRAAPGHISAVAVVVVAEDGHDHDEGADDDGEVERAREEGRVE